MDSAVISAMSGVLGSLVGGSATVATTWVTQRTQGKRELVRAEIKRREALYGEFISECSARLIESFECTLEKPATMLQVYALLNRIRLCASNAVLTEAERSCTSSPSNTSLRIFPWRNCAILFGREIKIRSSHSAKHAAGN